MPMPLSSDKLHLTMTKSSTFSGLRDALLAVTTFPAAENTLSDFELAAGTGKTILTRCERSVKYTLQLSWFTLPKTRPEPDPEPGLLTITRPEPDPKSKSATRQALIFGLRGLFLQSTRRMILQLRHWIYIQKWSSLQRSGQETKWIRRRHRQRKQIPDKQWREKKSKTHASKPLSQKRGCPEKQGTEIPTQPLAGMLNIRYCPLLIFVLWGCTFCLAGSKSCRPCSTRCGSW